MMIAVAIVAVTLAAEVTRRRTARLTAEYRARAETLLRKRSVAASHALATRVGIRMGWEPGPESIRKYESYVRQAEYAAAMDRKCRRATARP